MADETNAIYKILADFSALGVATKKAKEDLKDLEKAETDFNKNSAKNAKAVKETSDARAKGYRNEATEAGKATTALRHYKEALRLANQQQVTLNRNIRTSTTLFTNYRASVSAAREDVAGLRREHEGLNRAMTGSKSNNRDTNYTRLIREQTEAMNKLSEALRVNSRESSNNERTHDRNGKAIHRLGSGAARATGFLGSLSKQMNKFRDFRPRLIPPFVALIPIVGALLGMINPLVAGLSAAGVAAFGMASNLASISGAALAAIPGLVALISVVGALKASFNGIGEAFKQFGAMKKAASAPGGGGGSAQAELTRAEQIERAEVRVARAQEDVTFAQEDLTKAREEYYETIKKLTEQLNDLSEAEDKAKANAQLAAEWAETVAADPNATEADKQAAADFAVEKAEEAEEATKERQEGEKDLKEAKGKGVKEDRDVIMAQRRLLDAQWALRDAQLELINTQRGVNGAQSAAATAAAAYAAALAALSPSARKFVEFLTSMYDTWKKIQKTVQESFFSQFVDDLGGLEKLLGPISTLLNDAAVALGKLMGNLINQVSSPDWLSDLTSMSDTNVSIITSMGEAFQYVLEIVKDLAIVAAPLAEKLAGGFADGLERLMGVVDTARNNGSLAAWLSTVYERLQMWWRIVKNIGKTLFNYGAAASEFGDWLTSGLEALTESWVDSSREARDEGSAFKKYLQDIKEPLRAVGRLMKAFFGWWLKVASDEDNLESFTRIMDSITTKLGPAISRLLDLFAKSHTADNLISALEQILTLLGDFLEKGGLEGFEAFFSVMQGFFGAISEIIKKTPEGVIKNLAISLAIISALTFTGLGRVLQLFASLLGSSKLWSFFRGIRDTASFIGPAATAGGAFKAGAARTVVAGGKGLLAGSAAGLGLGVASSVVSDGQGGARDTVGAGLGGAATGAMIGGIIGSIIPGLGTGIGMGVGAALGFVAGSVQQDAKNREADFQANATNYERGTRAYTDAALRPRPISLDEANPNVLRSGTANGSLFPKDSSRDIALVGNAYEYSAGQADLMADNIAKVEQAQRRADSMLLTAEEHQRAYGDAIAATNLLFDTHRMLQEADAAATAAETEVTRIATQAEKDRDATGKVSKQTQEDALIASENLAQATRDQADAILAAGGSQEEANAILKTGETRLDKLADAAGLSKDEVNGLKESILQLPSTKKIDLRVDMPAADRRFLSGLMSHMGVGVTMTQEQRSNFEAAMNRTYGNNTGGSVHRSRGGGIPGVFEDWKGAVTGRGVNDSVSTMLTPGEFVMRRAAVQKYGLDTMRRMNAGMMVANEKRKGDSSMMRGSLYSSGRQSLGGDSPAVPAGLLQALEREGHKNKASLQRLRASQKASASSRFAGNIAVTVNNPVAQAAEASIYEVHRELAYKYGW